MDEPAFMPETPLVATPEDEELEELEELLEPEPLEPEPEPEEEEPVEVADEPEPEAVLLELPEPVAVALAEEEEEEVELPESEESEESEEVAGQVRLKRAVVDLSSEMAKDMVLAPLSSTKLYQKVWTLLKSWSQPTSSQ